MVSIHFFLTHITFKWQTRQRDHLRITLGAPAPARGHKRSGSGWGRKRLALWQITRIVNAASIHVSFSILSEYCRLFSVYTLSSYDYAPFAFHDFVLCLFISAIFTNLWSYNSRYSGLDQPLRFAFHRRGMLLIRSIRAFRTSSL